MANFKKDYKDTEVRTTHRTKVPRVTLTKVEPADDDKRTRAELLDAIEDLFQNTFQSGRKQSYDKEIDLESLRSILTMLVLSVTNNSDDSVGATQQQIDAINTNTSKTGITADQIRDIQANNAKNSITTSQSNAITANTSKTTFPGFGTSSGKALEGDTSLLQLGTSSSTALRGDTTTISTSQANAITANTSKPDLTTKGAGTVHADNYTDTNTQLSTEQVQDIVGGMLVGTETRIGVSYDDTNGRINFVVDDMTADTNTQLSLIDSDTMSGASATNVPSAESVKSYVDTSISNVLNSPPSALDTLNELAAALGDDANFSSTVTNSIATKAPIANPSFTGTIAIPNISNVENAIAANTAKTGITSSQANAISANSSKVSMVIGTESDEALAGNTTTISTSQASAITANSAKTGISTSQASAITANTAKTTFPGFGTSSSTALAGDTTTISTSQASAITANTAKVSQNLATANHTMQFDVVNQKGTYFLTITVVDASNPRIPVTKTVTLTLR